MSKNQKRKTYLVWRNGDDAIIAVDENADKCAELMGITRQAFYSCLKEDRCKKWTIIRSEELTA